VAPVRREARREPQSALCGAGSQPAAGTLPARWRPHSPTDSARTPICSLWGSLSACGGHSARLVRPISIPEVLRAPPFADRLRANPNPLSVKQGSVSTTYFNGRLEKIRSRR